jgi:hypothetical protein
MRVDLSGLTSLQRLHIDSDRWRVVDDGWNKWPLNLHTLRVTRVPIFEYPLLLSPLQHHLRFLHLEGFGMRSPSPASDFLFTNIEHFYWHSYEKVGDPGSPSYYTL